jgi:hypothetical protein
MAFAAAMAIAAGLAGASQARTTKTWRPLQVITALRRAGLPIGTVRYHSPASDPNKLLGRPGQYTGKANFHDRRLRGRDYTVDNGGSVETFASNSDASRRYKYVRAISTSSPLFAEWNYVEGTVVLRLSHELTPRQAKQYERALRGAV